jgi:hypothetical protein
LKAQGSFDFPKKQVLVYVYLRHYSRQEDSPILCSFYNQDVIILYGKQEFVFPKNFNIKARSVTAEELLK